MERSEVIVRLCLGPLNQDLAVRREKHPLGNRVNADIAHDVLGGGHSAASHLVPGDKIGGVLAGSHEQPQKVPRVEADVGFLPPEAALVVGQVLRLTAGNIEVKGARHGQKGLVVLLRQNKLRDVIGSAAAVHDMGGGFHHVEIHVRVPNHTAGNRLIRHNAVGVGLHRVGGLFLLHFLGGALFEGVHLRHPQGLVKALKEIDAPFARVELLIVFAVDPQCAVGGNRDGLIIVDIPPEAGCAMEFFQLIPKFVSHRVHERRGLDADIGRTQIPNHALPV